MFPLPYALECEALLKQLREASSGPEFEFREYKGKISRSDLVKSLSFFAGVVHGFASRPNLTIDSHKKGFDGAFEQTIKWFEKTL
jgi:hypothetical protein